MRQAEARAIARQVDGIAIQAKPSKKPGGWHFGGWADKSSVWVVRLPSGEVWSEAP